MFDPDLFLGIEECMIEAQAEAQVDQLSVFAEKIARETAKRDAAIRCLSRQGMSLRAIGTAVGLTHAGVAKILAKAHPVNRVDRERKPTNATSPNRVLTAGARLAMGRDVHARRRGRIVEGMLSRGNMLRLTPEADQ
jgi:hypothetical protein